MQAKKDVVTQDICNEANTGAHARSENSTTVSRSPSRNSRIAIAFLSRRGTVAASDHASPAPVFVNVPRDLTESRDRRQVVNAGEAREIVAGLLVRDGRVLLCHRSAGRQWFPDVWDLPGGHVERGEPPMKALARELEEELAIRVQQLGPELRRVVEPEFALRIWLVKKWVGDPVNASPAEHDDLRWFDRSEASSVPLAHTGYLSLIRDTIAG
jgi:8-oxo-dGTP diphosphatase